MQKYTKKYSNFVIINQENAGIISARNKAISHANGTYILPLDSDDKISINCVEILVKLILDGECSVAAPSIKFFGKANGPYNLPEPNIDNMSVQNCLVNCALFPKALWEQYGGYDQDLKLV